MLLDQLLAGLATVPGAEELLLGVSVYRSPVDQAGMLFQVGTSDPTAEIIPDYTAATEQIKTVLADVLRSAGVDPATVGLARH